MTTLIGPRCKSGNIFSRLILIGRGLFLTKLGDCVKDLFLAYNFYATFKVRRYVTSSSVTKREETTRSHLEHGRKDS